MDLHGVTNYRGFGYSDSSFEHWLCVHSLLEYLMDSTSVSIHESDCYMRSWCLLAWIPRFTSLIPSLGVVYLAISFPTLLTG